VIRTVVDIFLLLQHVSGWNEDARDDFRTGYLPIRRQRCYCFTLLSWYDVDALRISIAKHRHMKNFDTAKQFHYTIQYISINAWANFITENTTRSH
jgi:hypothetical protein